MKKKQRHILHVKCDIGNMSPSRAEACMAKVLKTVTKVIGKKRYDIIVTPNTVYFETIYTPK